MKFTPSLDEAKEEPGKWVAGRGRLLDVPPTNTGLYIHTGVLAACLPFESKKN